MVQKSIGLTGGVVEYFTCHRDKLREFQTLEQYKKYPLYQGLTPNFSDEQCYIIFAVSKL